MVGQGYNSVDRNRKFNSFQNLEDTEVALEIEVWLVLVQDDSVVFVVVEQMKILKLAVVLVELTGVGVVMTVLNFFVDEYEFILEDLFF